MGTKLDFEKHLPKPINLTPRPWGAMKSVEKTAVHVHKARLRGAVKIWQRNSERYQSNWKKPLSKAAPYRKEGRIRARLRLTVAKEQREIQEAARQGAHGVMERMITIAQTSLNETAAIAAGSVVLDRAYGKANQTNINAQVDVNGKTAEVSSKELTARIEKALGRITELTGGAEKPPRRKKPTLNLREFDRDPDSSSLH